MSIGRGLGWSLGEGLGWSLWWHLGGLGMELKGGAWVG